MSYTEHLIANFRVAARCLVLATFHAVHGVIPCRYTSHEYWGIGSHKQRETESILSEAVEIERLLASIPHDNVIERASLKARLELVEKALEMANTRGDV